MIHVDTPSGERLDDVRDLMRAFIAWHRERNRDDLDLIDRYFDPAAYRAELDGLPGPYAPPDGALLLATLDGEPAGCVALQRLDPQTCEMKRMFVHGRCQGHGVGRALGEAIIEAGRTLGYQRMRLDTSFRQHEALTLYRRLGFTEIEPYYEGPAELIEWLVFMELRL